MRSRTVRFGMGAAAVVVALALGGCSGGGDGDDGGGGKAAGKGSASASASKGSSSTPDEGSSSGAGPGSVKDAEGIWKASTGGKPVVLVVGAKQAALTTADGHLCTGTLAGAGKPTLTLRCADGNTDRTKGAVESNDGSTMRVSWDAGQKDTFKKSKDGELPTDLPSGLPTN
ncbi:hypothetical protein [Streptomyces endophyticus]|uniref:Lipoprotein n=1 Tax=Streptomyces endophyticus TaxID=714166 RepID=A0ABU6FH89_9ACTN|nr:hypothetical protein [Streptomyces endophyticus]MEB8343405.1 hypothetical protein [Streptomyces endophyticus]